MKNTPLRAYDLDGDEDLKGALKAAKQMIENQLESVPKGGKAESLMRRAVASADKVMVSSAPILDGFTVGHVTDEYRALRSVHSCMDFIRDSASMIRDYDDGEFDNSDFTFITADLSRTCKRWVEAVEEAFLS